MPQWPPREEAAHPGMRNEAIETRNVHRKGGRATHPNARKHCERERNDQTLVSEGAKLPRRAQTSNDTIGAEPNSELNRCDKKKAAQQ